MKRKIARPKNPIEGDFYTDNTSGIIWCFLYNEWNKLTG